MHHQSQQGQATVEMLVSMLALVPLLVLIPEIGKLLDIKAKGIEANRYAAFERTVFSDPFKAWGSGENRLLEEQIVRDTDKRFLTDPRTPILSAGSDLIVDVNPLWKNYRGDQLLPPQRTGRLALGVNATGVPVPRESSVDQVTGEFGLFGPGELGLGLNQDGFVSSSVGITALDLPDFSRRGAAIDIDPDPGNRVAYIGGAAVLTDSWVPGDEDNFADRIDGITIDEALSGLVTPGTLFFTLIPPFFEGVKGTLPELRSESAVVPPEYIDFQ